MSTALWQPSATIETLKKRALALTHVRAFFSSRGIVEVETPCISTAASTDPALESWVCTDTAQNANHTYLHTSPEFFMKRMLAAGSGDIYQIARVFRREELGRWHNPEFTLIEWYRVGLPYRGLLEETLEFVSGLLNCFGRDTQIKLYSYQSLFQNAIGIDPLLVTKAELAELIRSLSLNLNFDINTCDIDQCLQLLLTHVIEPKFPHKQLTAIYDFPASQAALARLRQDTPPIAERFEIYYGSLELANGFQELLSSSEQAARFQSDVEKRKIRGQRLLPIDKHFLAALSSGMPEASGVALGFDRLLAAALGLSSIAEVMAFEFGRC